MAKRDLLLFLCVLCLFLPFHGAYGAELGVTWNGSAGDFSWNTSTNWTPGDMPNNNGTNTFGVTIGLPGTTVNLSGGITIDNLTMNSSTLNMYTGGPNSLTLATGASSLSNSSIVSGTITNNGTLTLNKTTFYSSVLVNNGTINTGNTAGGPSVLSGTLINNAGASINVVNGSVLELEGGGTYTNNGTINLGSTGAPAALALDASSGTGNTITLGGSGTLTLSNNVNNSIQDTMSGLTLVNGANHTIQGAGTVGDGGLTLVNLGNITASGSAGMSITAGSMTNSGQITATAGSILGITSGSINNASGTILANGGMVQLPGPGGGSETITGGNISVVNGGTLTASSSTTLNGVTMSVDGSSSASLGGHVGNGSTVTVSGTLTLDGATFNSSLLNNSGTVKTTVSTLSTLSGALINNAGASINVVNGSALELEGGGTYTNNGTINIGSTGAQTELALDESNGATSNTVTLGGSGTLTLSNNSNNSIQETGSGMTLVNGAGHTIQGAGTIGDGGLTLVNLGNITASGSAGMSIIAGSMTNSGLIAATAGSTLGITSHSITNTGGTILANGGTVQLPGPGGGSETITGGNISVVNGGTLTASSSTILNGVTMSVDGTSSASLGGQVGNGSGVVVSGTLTLDGAKFNGSLLTNGGTVNTTVSTLSTLSGALFNGAGASINIVNGSALELEGGGTYTNNGTINIGSTGTLTALVLDASNGATSNTVTLGGSGTLTLSNNSNNSIQETGSGMTLVNGAGHTIQGAGTIGDGGLTLVNLGNITASGSAGMSIIAGSMTNSGLIAATAGSTLGITSGSINNASGTILANGGTVQLPGPGGGSETITGGNISVVNGGTLTASSSTTLNGVTMSVDGSSSASLGGHVGNGSTVTVSGTLTLDGATFNSSLLNNSGTVKTTVSTLSTLSGALINNAGASINVVNGSALELESGGTYTNAGTINVMNTAQLSVLNGADLTNFQSGTLTGGTYNIAGTMNFDIGDLVTNQAAITMSGSGSVWADASGPNGLSDFSTNGAQGQFSLLNGASLQSGGDFTNSGAVTIGAGSSFTMGSSGTNNYTQTGGSTVVDGTLQATTVNLNGGDISGTGALVANVENEGSVDPGDAPGTLTIEGNYTQGSGGVLDIEIDGASDYDRLIVTGAAQLNGTLNVTFGGGFSPYDFETFSDVMTFTSVTGNFSSVDQPGNWVEIWSSNTLSLEFVTPEPSTWVLLAAGLIGFGWFRRRAGARG